MRILTVLEVHKVYRYFFHASEDRRMSAEYNEPNSEDEEMDDEERKQTSREQVASLKISATPECVEAKVEEPAEDPALADWLTVDTKQTVTDDSATEPESDADSVNDDVDKDIDEWIAVEPSGSDTLDSFHVSVSAHMVTNVASATHVFTE